MPGDAPHPGGERALLGLLASVLPRGTDGGVFFGDDAAVVASPSGELLLLASDCVVEEVHFARSLSSLSDVGWKVLSANVSDLAAMGGAPLAAVVAVAGPHAGDLEPLYAGLLEASARYECPIVGGDLSAGPTLVVSIGVLGRAGERPPVLRRGARAGDKLFCTGALGRSAAGLRLLREDREARGPLVDAHRRPLALLAAGEAASRGGATAMIDVSDGLALDLDRLATASGVGVRLETVPVAPGATFEEALRGGEDYELVFAAPPEASIEASFARAGLLPPRAIGRCVADPAERSIAGEPFEAAGYEHRFAT